MPAKLRGIRGDESGSIIQLFAMMLPIVLAAVGGAIDYGRASQERDRLQSALDAAVLAGLRNYQTSRSWADADVAAHAAFRGHFNMALDGASQSRAASPPRDQPVVSFTSDPETRSMSATARMTVTTPFMQLVMGEHFAVKAASTAEISSPKPAQGKDHKAGTTAAMAEAAKSIDMTKLRRIAGEIRKQMWKDIWDRYRRGGQLPSAHELKQHEKEFHARIVAAMPEAAPFIAAQNGAPADVLRLKE